MPRSLTSVSTLATLGALMVLRVAFRRAADVVVIYVFLVSPLLAQAKLPSVFRLATRVSELPSRDGL